MRDLSPTNDPSGERGGEDETNALRMPVTGNGPAGDDVARPPGILPDHGADGSGATRVDRTEELGHNGADADGSDGTAPDGADATGGPGRRRFWRRKKEKKPRSLRRTIVEWVLVIGGGVAIALLIEAFLIQAFWIPSESMTPTLNVDDRVLVNKRAYSFGDVGRSDIIVFERPEAAVRPGTEDDTNDLIKRVVAVEGDTIESREGRVYVNGEPQDESYLEPGTPTSNLPRQRIPEDHVFVMGDNRTNSDDSRIFGPVSEDDIVGKAFWTVWPPGSFGRP